MPSSMERCVRHGILAAALLLLLLPGPARSQDAAARSFFDQGVNALQANRIPEAISLFEASLSADPRNNLARYYYGAALVRAERPFDALRELSAASLHLQNDAVAADIRAEILRARRLSLSHALARPIGSSPRRTAPTTACDRLAQPPRDEVGAALAVVDGVVWGRMDDTAAVGACRAAMAEYPSEARFQAYLGRAQLHRGEVVDGFFTIREAAHAGDAWAQFEWGRTLEGHRSLGIPANRQEAARYFAAAAAQGHRGAGEALRSTSQGTSQAVQPPPAAPPPPQPHPVRQRIQQAEGRWTTAAPGACPVNYWLWRNDQSNIDFINHMNDVFREEVTRIFENGFEARTTHLARPSPHNQVGDLWTYVFQEDGRIRVRNQRTGNAFSLTRCP